jgi:NADH-quinone oxidoreductase subunit A
MRDQYIPFLMLFAFVVANALGFVVLSHFAGPRRPTAEKGQPYESGMPPLGGAHERFSVKFYLIAMLFILFDIETVFLIPWGAIFFARGDAVGRGPGMGFLLVEMLIFILILLVGYVYVWKRRGFEWD